MRLGQHPKSQPSNAIQRSSWSPFLSLLLFPTCAALNSSTTMHNLTNFFEVSMANPRSELSDDRSGAVVNLPAEFNERTVLVNLDGVTSINSWGIAIFMEALQRITEHGGNLVLFGIRDDV